MVRGWGLWGRNRGVVAEGSGVWRLGLRLFLRGVLEGGFEERWCRDRRDEWDWR